MIVRLKTEGFVLLDGVDVPFGPGMTVLSGGSGEGKTVLLSALRFALGEGSGGKATARRLVRRGADEATVEVWLSARRGSALAAALAAQGARRQGCLTRVIHRSGRSRCLLDGQSIGLVQLRAIGSAAAEIFGQGDAQHLTDAGRQLALLDAYGGLRERAAEIERRRDGVRALRTEHDSLVQGEAQAHERFAARASVRRVLSVLDPCEGELAELRARRTELEERAGRRTTLVRLIHTLVEGDGALLDALYDAASDLDSLGVLAQASSELEEAAALVEGVAAAIRREHDADERGDSLEAIRERLGAFRSAAQRLGTSPERLAALWIETQAELDPTEWATRRLAAERALADEVDALVPLSTGLTRARTRAAKRLAKAVTAQLPELGLGGARFQIALKQDATGSDSVAFSFAAHAGADPAGLERASGGELARLFLALGLEVAGRADERLLVFDEVDQNVGARLGAAVGSCLAGIGRGRQVLTITHLAPVAARAEQHLKVTKARARATVQTLDDEARVEELALMIRGAPLTATAIEQARELLEEARREPGIRRRKKVHAG